MRIMMEAGDFQNGSHQSNLSSLPIAEQVFYISTTELANRERDVSTEYFNASDQVDLMGLEVSGGTIGFGIPDSEAAIATINYCFGVILIIIGIVGSSGNALVLYVFSRYRKLRGGGKPLVLSLASGDLLMSVLHLLPAVSSFHQKWAFGSVGCSLYAAVVGLCGIASLLTLSAIAANRFSVIVGRPLAWLDGNKSCFFIWMLSGSLTFPPFFGWSQYSIEGMGTSCAWDYLSRDFYNRLYYIFLLTIGFVLPVSTIVISYIGILYVVCSQSTKAALFETSNAIRAKRTTTNELKTVKVTLTIIICFLTAWTPYAIVSLIGQFGDEGSKVSPLGTALPAIFAKTSVIFNPCVYGLSHPNFRSALRRLRVQRSRKKYRITNTAMNNQNTMMNNLNTTPANQNTAHLNNHPPDHNANKYSNHQAGSFENGNNVGKASANGNGDSPLSSIRKPTDSVKGGSPQERISDNIKPAVVDGTSVLPRHLLFCATSSFEDLRVAVEIQGEKRVQEKNVRMLEHRERHGGSYYSRNIIAPKHHGSIRRAYSYVGTSGEHSNNLHKFLSLSESYLDILVTIDCHRPGLKLMDAIEVLRGNPI